eukprot:COSAG02_NODE_1058_length_14905_cov_7.369882_4_plen_1301_part_00
MSAMVVNGGGLGASRAEIAELREVFAKFHPVLHTTKDRQGNEDTELVITANELGMVMRKLGQDVLPNELADMIEDNDGKLTGHGTPDGVLDFPEFIHMMSRKLHDQAHKQEVQEAFQVFDTDRSGYISAKELCNVMNNLGIDLPNEDGTPMSEAEVADLICDWGPVGKDGRRARRPGMSWERFWSEIQGADGIGKKKKKGRAKLAQETERLVKKAQMELKQAREAAQAVDGRYEAETEEAFEKRQREAQDVVTAAEKKLEDLKSQSTENVDEVTVTRLDIKRFAAQDNESTHEAVKMNLPQQIERTVRTRTFLGTRFLTTDAAQMARRFSVRLAGMDKSGAIDLGEIKGALQEFDRYGDQSVFVQELGMVCEVLARRPMKNTLNALVETLRDTKHYPNAPWCCVGSPPWQAWTCERCMSVGNIDERCRIQTCLAERPSGAAGCRCPRPVKSAGMAVDRLAPFVSCEHDADNFTISVGRDGIAANKSAKQEKHTSKCVHGSESWSAFCARRASIHGYGSISDPRRQRLSWTRGHVPGGSCAFCCVSIKAGAVTHDWAKTADGNRWIEVEVDERTNEKHDPLEGLWAHIFPGGAEWRAGRGFPKIIDAPCEDCEDNHARFCLGAHAKQQEKLELKHAYETLQDEEMRNHGDTDTAEERIHNARTTKVLAEKRVSATEAAERDSRMRWCETCANTQRVRFNEGAKDQRSVQSLEDVESKIERDMASFMRRRKPQELLAEIRRVAMTFQAKAYYGEIRDKLLRRRVLEENKSGFTPMHCAARDGRLGCVHALLVHDSTALEEDMVPVGKSVAYTWDPYGGTAYKLDPPQDADRRPGLRHPDYDVWPTSTSLQAKMVWCGTQEGQGPIQGRGITEQEIQEIRDSTGAVITVPSGLNTDNEAWKRAEEGPDAGSGTEAAPVVIVIEGSCNAQLDGCESPILVAKRNLKALRLRYFLGHLRELYATGVATEKSRAKALNVAKENKQKITDELMHLERTMQTKQTQKQEEHQQQLKAEEKKKDADLVEKRLAWNTCVDNQRIQAHRIAEVEVDYQMMQPSEFDTVKRTQKLLATADLMGFTPLHWACRNGHTAVALALIAEGAHPTALSKKGRTPLEEAEAFLKFDAGEEGEELSKINQSSLGAELVALRAAEERRRNCVAELRAQCPLMGDEPLNRGTQIIVAGYGHGEYVRRKQKASSGLCGRGTRCAVHIVRFTAGGEEQHLPLKEMSWQLHKFKAERLARSTKAFTSTTTGNSSGDSSFDGLEQSAAKPTAEPEPALPGGVPSTPSKYVQAHSVSARTGKKLEL